jgi:hypothetical protein
MKGKKKNIHFTVLNVQEIQAQSSLRLWIGLPNFTINMANPFEIDDKINTVITELQAKGVSV